MRSSFDYVPSFLSYERLSMLSRGFQKLQLLHLANFPWTARRSYDCSILASRTCDCSPLAPVTAPTWQICLGLLSPGNHAPVSGLREWRQMTARRQCAHDRNNNHVSCFNSSSQTNVGENHLLQLQPPYQCVAHSCAQPPVNHAPVGALQRPLTKWPWSFS